MSKKLKLPQSYKGEVEVIAEVAKKVNLTKAQVKDTFVATREVVQTELEALRKVSIPEIGVLEPTYRPKKEGVKGNNPSTNESIIYDRPEKYSAKIVLKKNLRDVFDENMKAKDAINMSRESLDAELNKED